MSLNASIAAIRTDYKQKTLNEADVAKEPIAQFTTWWTEAIASEIDEVNAMTLATASKDGIPAARIVLLKSYDDKGFVFFTNYNSHKGKALDENPHAAIVFFWKELERQVRITGTVEKISAADSDAYFHSRPPGSRIGAWSSPQSEVISDRSVLDNNIDKYTKEFESDIPRPEHWGGYVIQPVEVEFWQGRSNRLHDRILYTKQGENEWKIERLAP